MNNIDSTRSGTSDAETKPKKFVYHSYFGFLPESEADDYGIDVGAAKKFVYSRYYGFVPVSLLLNIYFLSCS